MVAARLLRKQAGAASFGVPKLPLNAVALRAGLRIVELYHDLPAHDRIAVFDEYPSHNPAFQVLNGLAAGSGSMTPDAIAALFSGARTDQVPNPTMKTRINRFPVQTTPLSPGMGEEGAGPRRFDSITGK